MAFFLFHGVLMAAILLGGWVVHWRVRHHPDYDRNAVLERSFEALTFPLQGGGQISGQAVRVVKRPAASVEVSLFLSAAGHDAGRAEEFWYAVGPEGHYWLAMASCERHWLLWRVHWVLRPLSAGRLRNALMDDPVALHAAFGDVQVDRLYA